jgi:hypothetical protein
MQFNPGDRVRLKANPAEGWPEQEAIVVRDEGAGGNPNYKDHYLVEVDVYEGDMDDGLREVVAEDMEPI